MANLYSIKTTANPALNNLAKYPLLSIYVNQALYEKYVDKAAGTIIDVSNQSLTDTYFRRALEDIEGIYKRRKLYYNYYSENNQQFATDNNRDLLLVLRELGAVTMFENMSDTQCNILYNGRSYGDMYCFTNLPGAGGSGYRVNSILYLGQDWQGALSNIRFGGYYLSANYSSNNFSYDGCGAYYFRFHVFPDAIFDENGAIQNPDNSLKAIVLSLRLSYSKTNNLYRYVVDYEGTILVSNITSASMFYGVIPPENTNDPYAPQGSVDQGGGDGTYDGTSDTISEPNLPTLSALDTGFVTVFKPTKTQLKDLYDYLWTGLFDIDNFRKIFANPIDTIMGFGIVPINLVTGAAKEVKVGNIGTGVNMSPVTEQYYRLDCGTITISEYWGTYLDYEPYFTMDLYLPYIGSVPISTDDIKRNWVTPKTGTIQVVYHVDILSGACVAYIICNGSVAYEYAGSCLTQLPITGNDFTSTFQSIIGIAGNVASAGIKIAAGGSAGILNDATNAAHNVMNAKPTINRSGGVASTSGLMGVQTPYLILNRPIPAIADNQNSYTGYPAHMTKRISEVHGYTEWEQVWFKDIPATDPELQELKTLLDGGVIL